MASRRYVFIDMVLCVRYISINDLNSPNYIDLPKTKPYSTSGVIRLIK